MKRIIVLLTAASLLLGFPVLTGCKKADNSASDSATQYTCAHHPEVVQSAPGKCPKCNMDLTVKK